MAFKSNIPTAAEDLSLETSERLTRPFKRFADLSSSGGIVLIGATIIALIWANSAWGESYHYFFHEIFFSIGLADAPVTVGEAAKWDGGVVGKNYNFHWWINDLLMAIFFLLVGLEIKREIMVGELASVKKAALPIFAAIGGMVGPALIYVAVNFGNSETIGGWGIPMATDIAFALGILALIGSKAPNSLKVFLTSLAIADDLGALIVIAAFYTDKLDLGALSICGGIMAVLIALNLLGFRRVLWYVVPGLFLWFFVYESGVHATIAGVLLAATIPVSSRVNANRYLRYSRAALNTFEQSSSDEEDAEVNSSQRAAVYAIEKNNHFVMSLLHRMEHALHPWVAFLIIPVFALANAGVHIGGDFVNNGIGGFFRTIANDPIMLGILLGLFIGKPIGIFGFAFIAVKLKLASLPRGISWKHIFGAGCLAGIGFTMAIFIGNLAFKDRVGMTDEQLALALEHREHATIAILLASFLSTIAGLAFLIMCKDQPEPEPDELGPELRMDDDSGN